MAAKPAKPPTFEDAFSSAFQSKTQWDNWQDAHDVTSADVEEGSDLDGEWLREPDNVEEQESSGTDSEGSMIAQGEEPNEREELVERPKMARSMPSSPRPSAGGSASPSGFSFLYQGSIARSSREGRSSRSRKSSGDEPTVEPEVSSTPSSPSRIIRRLQPRITIPSPQSCKELGSFPAPRSGGHKAGGYSSAEHGSTPSSCGSVSSKPRHLQHGSRTSSLESIKSTASPVIPFPGELGDGRSPNAPSRISSTGSMKSPTIPSPGEECPDLPMLPPAESADLGSVRRKNRPVNIKVRSAIQPDPPPSGEPRSTSASPRPPHSPASSSSPKAVRIRPILPKMSASPKAASAKPASPKSASSQRLPATLDDRTPIRPRPPVSPKSSASPRSAGSPRARSFVDDLDASFSRGRRFAESNRDANCASCGLSICSCQTLRQGQSMSVEELLRSCEKDYPN